MMMMMMIMVTSFPLTMFFLFFISPLCEDTPGMQVNDMKKLGLRMKNEDDDATIDVVRHIIQKHELSTAAKICSDIREVN